MDILSEKEDNKDKSVAVLPESLNVQSSNKFSRWLNEFKKKYKVSLLFDIINLAFSVTCSGLYIYSTYDPNMIMRNYSFFLYSFLARIYFLIDFVLNLFAMKGENKISFYTYIMVELVSIVPYFCVRIYLGLQDDMTNQGHMITSAFICVRIFRIQFLSSYIQSDVNRELFNIMCSIFSLLVSSTAIINVIENTETIGKYWLFLPRDCSDKDNCIASNDSFHSSFFFVMTTVATLGYYSTINSVAGKCIIICLILISVIEIPSQSSNLMKQLSSKSVFARLTYKKLEKVDFILISGNISYGSIVVLLQEYFHPDHGENERHALILLPQRPDNNMKSLLQEFQNKLYYFEGDPSKLNDLKRCQFKSASMIILLCNKQTDDSTAEDSKTIIQAMAIRKYLAQMEENRVKKELRRGSQIPIRGAILELARETEDEKEENKESDENQAFENGKKEENKETDRPLAIIPFSGKQINQTGASSKKSHESKLLIQLLRPESEHHFALSISKKNSTDQILCIDELKLSLLAKSCMCQGIIALISNLIITNNMEECNEKFIGKTRWSEEYREGKDYEIYKIQLDFLRGYTFNKCCELIYNEKKIVVFGLNIESRNDGSSLVLLNPWEFIIPVNRDVSIYGYCLAKNQKDADSIVSWSQTKKKLSSKQTMDRIPLSPIKRVLSNTSGFSMKKRGTLYFDELNEIDEESHSNDEKDNDLYSTDAITFAKICHITTEHIDKASVTLDSIDSMLIAKGHIIICGICQNFTDFIKPLRAKYLPKSECPTIVILSKELIDDKVWNSIAFFDQIYLIQGDPMNKTDLKRAGIKNAKKVVILAPSIQEISQFTLNRRNKNVNYASYEDMSFSKQVTARKLTQEEEDLLDAKTVFKYNMISRMKRDIFVVVELINPNNVSFLNNKGRKQNDEYRFIKADMNIDTTASFAAGEVYYSSIMDNLITQAYYNPSLLSVLKKLIVGEDQNGYRKAPLSRYKDIVSGHLYLISIPIGDFQRNDGDNTTTYRNIDREFDFMIPVNRKLRFEEVFASMLRRKIVVIGVYRAGNIQKEKPISNERLACTVINKEKSRDYTPFSGGNNNLCESKNNTANFFALNYNYNNFNNNAQNSNKENSSFYYVVTSPDANFILTPKDKLFVISQTFPDEETLNSNFGVNENNNGKIDLNADEDLFKKFENSNFSKMHKKLDDKKEITKDFDQEGEEKLKKFNNSLKQTIDLLKEIEDSIGQVKDQTTSKISESIKNKIQKIFKENKLECV